MNRQAANHDKCMYPEGILVMLSQVCFPVEIDRERRLGLYNFVVVVVVGMLLLDDLKITASFQFQVHILCGCIRCINQLIIGKESFRLRIQY